MTNYHFLIFAILSLVLPLRSAAQDRFFVRTCDAVGDVRPDNASIKMPFKAMRNSNQAGIIHLIPSSDIPDNVLEVAQRAKETWESKIKNKYPVYIGLEYKAFNDNDAIVTDVYYTFNHEAVPNALNAQLIGRNDDCSDSPDAIIAINPDVKWDFRYDSSSVTGEKNLYSAMLRAFATGLGFGASVTVDNSQGIRFAIEGHPSAFDKLVKNNDGALLSELDDYSPRLQQFCESKIAAPIYVLAADDNHKLYAPETFIENVSLRYLDNPASLMHYDMAVDDKRLAVDDETAEILDAMGWNVPTADAVRIVCDNIGDTGIGSAYKSHEFSLEGCDESAVENPEWKFEVLDADGRTVATQTATGMSFTLAPLKAPTSYPTNGDGDIRGVISFNGTLDGKDCMKKFAVFLELKPKIISVSEPHFEYKEDSFDVYLSVTYIGSDYITASLEEDYSSAVRRYRIEQPYYAAFAIKDVSYYFYSWIDLSVQNGVGTDSYSLEIEPQTKPDGPVGAQEDISVIPQDSVIEIYNLNGLKINEPVTALPKGIYIIKTASSSHGNTIRKLMVK